MADDFFVYAVFDTDVFGISAAEAGVIFLIARIWDAVNDPILGFVVDRTETRWGKFRPYLLFGAIPLGICLVLAFSTPDLGHTGKLVWALVTYIMLGMVYTAVNLPYGSLQAVCTQDPYERSSLAAYRMIFGFLGVLVVGGLTKPIVGRFADEQVGFQCVAAIYAVLGVIIFWIVFGIRALFTLGPFISGVVAVIIMNFYLLDSKLFARIVDDLEKRR
ncbi:MAG: hypothetical protein GY866_20860 [Proteobacteria bacterium]|nr:hypothetical protein [Pseudomonadota bacterium]